MERLGRTLQWLYALELHGVKLGLERMEAALELLGNPHRKFRAVIVGGTNGKGSVCAMMESVLRSAGYRTGLYTSPHLLRFNERIRVRGREIAGGDVVRIAAMLRRVIMPKVPLSFFEFVTVMAFVYFKERKVEVAVVEVGLGGRLDATNVVAADVAVITNVTLEHTEYLGKSVGKIAREKAGIIRKGAVVVTAAEGEALRVVRRKCAVERALLREVRGVAKVESLQSGLGGQSVVVAAGRRYLLHTSLAGAYQLQNVACAVAALEAMEDRNVKIGKKSIIAGMGRASWPGRLQVVCRKPFVLVDVAHNPGGMAALRQAIEGLLGVPLLLVIGIATDKDRERMLRIIAPLADGIVATSAKQRGTPAAVIGRLAGKHCRDVVVKESVEGAMRYAVKHAGSRAVLVTGSIFVVGEAMQWWKSGKKGLQSL